MLEEFEKRDLKKEQAESLKRITKIMDYYHGGIKNKLISPEIEKQKEKEIKTFIESLWAKNIEPTEYQLYYVLINKEPKPGEYKFDTPPESMIDPNGAGLIENFIEKSFSGMSLVNTK